jgi:hypothetical protein
MYKKASQTITYTLDDPQIINTYSLTLKLSIIYFLVLSVTLYCLSRQKPSNVQCT